MDPMLCVDVGQCFCSECGRMIVFRSRSSSGLGLQAGLEVGFGLGLDVAPVSDSDSDPCRPIALSCTGPSSFG